MFNIFVVGNLTSIIILCTGVARNWLSSWKYHMVTFHWDLQIKNHTLLGPTLGWPFPRVGDLKIDLKLKTALCVRITLPCFCSCQILLIFYVRRISGNCTYRYTYGIHMGTSFWRLALNLDLVKRAGPRASSLRHILTNHSTTHSSNVYLSQQGEFKTLHREWQQIDQVLVTAASP